MLIFSIVMFGISGFFLFQGKLVAEIRSELLKEYCENRETAQAVGKLLRTMGLCALISGGLMLLCLLKTKMTGEMPRWIAVSAISIYGGGFVFAMLKLRRIQGKGE